MVTVVERLLLYSHETPPLDRRLLKARITPHLLVGYAGEISEVGSGLPRLLQLLVFSRFGIYPGMGFLAMGYTFQRSEDAEVRLYVASTACVFLSVLARLYMKPTMGRSQGSDDYN